MKRTIYLLLSWILFPSLALADGGTLRLSQHVGDWQISVFTSPAALRAGPIDVSVLLQDAATGQVRTDIPVSIRLNPLDQPALIVEKPATTSAATNKLFRAALFDVVREGAWHANISIDDKSTGFDFDFAVAPPQPAWLQLAPWIAWPLPVVAIFVWHQRLVSRRAPRRGPAGAHRTRLPARSLGTSA